MHSDNIHLYYIAHSPETLASMPPGYAVLDNMAHQRDDWREYWPIRNFLINSNLDNDAWYGFFSPRFHAKTGLLPGQVRKIIHTNGSDMEVFTFSPQPDMGAFFLNVFEQEDTFTPGFLNTCELFFKSIGAGTDLRTMIMDSRHVVFSNYIVAKPKFWRAWLSLNEKLFTLCENGENDLQRLLTQETRYPGQVQLKVFLMERVASFMLAREKWHTYAYNTFNCAWSASRLNQFQDSAIISDALKIAIREQGHPEYLQQFSRIRDSLR